jgi:2-polyprenyl-3-methyl-5-hydroxy-6-metoxy-1,4-benzoquinol methylase
MRRSPCTSLYGNWRPTTGTESIQQTKKKLGRTVKSTNQKEPEFEDDGEPKKMIRGRPAMEIKSAVKEDLLPEFVARAAHVLEMNGGSMDSNLFGQHWKHLHPQHPIYAFKQVKCVTIHQMLRENSRFFEVSDTTRHKVKFFTLRSKEVTDYLNECNKAGNFVDSSSLVVASMAESVRGAVENMGAAFPADDDDDEADEPAHTLSEDKYLDHSLLEMSADDDLEAPLPMQPPRGGVVHGEDERVVHHDVPMQGKARMSHSHISGFDRRLKGPARVTKESRSFDAYREELPQAPQADARDALEHPVVSLYNSWAMDGRDVVMEVTHASAFDEMWEHVTEGKLHPKKKFTAIDGGCGNGWAARKMAQHPLCQAVIGVDAAAVMVDRAQSLTPVGDSSSSKTTYIVGDVAEWAPEAEVDLVNLCEMLYLLDQPQAALDHIVPTWLKPGGLLVANLDCYWENKLSHAWEGDLGVPMHCMSEKQWEKMFEKAGLVNIKRWRSKQNGPWQGTLLITGERMA